MSTEKKTKPRATPTALPTFTFSDPATEGTVLKILAVLVQILAVETAILKQLKG